MIEKVLLMSLPAVIEERDTYLDDGKSFHLGLAYLAAVLRDRGLNIQILDSYIEARENIRDTSEEGWIELGLSDDDIVKNIDRFNPDLIGITIPFSCQHYLAVTIARMIRERFPQTVLVAGGNHVTACPELLPQGLFDFLILGEGEHTFRELIDRLNQSDDLESIRRELPDGVYPKPSAEPLSDLDELPFPAIDLFPLDKLWGRGRRWINLTATRGCVYDCVFCSIHTVMGNTVRRRSVDNVIAEIEHWNELYQIEEVYFEDDNLTFHRRWARELFDQLAKRSLGIRFYVRNGVRADTLNLDLLKSMKAAGFQDIVIAPESGSRRILRDVIDKKMEKEDYIHAAKLAHSIHLGVNAFFVLGFVEESWKDIQETIRFAEQLKSIGTVGFWFSLACPFPGTRLYNDYKERGLIPEDVDFRRFRSVDYVISNPLYKSDAIKAFRAHLMQEFSPRKTRGRSLSNALTYLLTDPHLFLRKLIYSIRLKRLRHLKVFSNHTKLIFTTHSNVEQRRKTSSRM